MGVAGCRVHYADTDMSLGNTQCVMNNKDNTRLALPAKGKAAYLAWACRSNMSTCEAQSCASAPPCHDLCQCVESARSAAHAVNASAPGWHAATSSNK
jgi:hypothetical protein